MTRDTFDGTLLHSAAANNNGAMIQFLYEHGLPLDAQMTSGETALISAAYNNNKLAVCLLCKLGANPNLARKRDRYAPLHYAALHGDVQSIKALVQNGARLDAETAAGKTPLMIALQGKKEAVIELLRSLGATR
jgi:ankyrin repeat protein